ncbi:hypothetical protein BDM02DRAFT_872739 [Thelephora ganbajun]|uniref:Uncharacterized protein n=1 Tax=Thelephora ganbajun TaxID=370292 RepID=A0ACB6Z541_THEGA|nr:hypothetical protein BDM02DRAFT_872739 [Thelephora ganbajun]
MGDDNKGTLLCRCLSLEYIVYLDWLILNHLSSPLESDRPSLVPERLKFIGDESFILGCFLKATNTARLLTLQLISKVPRLRVILAIARMSAHRLEAHRAGTIDVSQPGSRTLAERIELLRYTALDGKVSVGRR